jgi:hypothetical protein
MSVFTCGPRPILTPDTDLKRLYHATNWRVLAVRIRMAELLVDAQPRAASRYIHESLFRARAFDNKFKDDYRKVHAECVRLGAQLLTVTSSWTATLVASLLCDDEVPEPFIELETHYGAQYLADIIAELAFGIRDSRCAGLLAAYAASADLHATRWVLAQLMTSPIPVWLVPVLIDAASTSMKFTKRADWLIRFAGKVRSLAKASLTDAQVEVAFTLAYDGGMDPLDIIAVSRQLA